MIDRLSPSMQVEAGYAHIWPKLTEASRESLRRMALAPGSSTYASPGVGADLLRLAGDGVVPTDIFVAWTESYLVDWQPVISERFLDWMRDLGLLTRQPGAPSASP